MIKVGLATKPRSRIALRGVCIHRANGLKGVGQGSNSAADDIIEKSLSMSSAFAVCNCCYNLVKSGRLPREKMYTPCRLK